MLLVQSTAIRKTLFFLILFSSIGIVSICRSLSSLLHGGRDNMSSSLVLFWLGWHIATFMFLWSGNFFYTNLVPAWYLVLRVGSCRPCCNKSMLFCVYYIIFCGRRYAVLAKLISTSTLIGLACFFSVSYRQFISAQKYDFKIYINKPFLWVKMYPKWLHIIYEI